MAIGLGTIYGDVRLNLDQLKSDALAADDVIQTFRDSMLAAFAGFDPFAGLDEGAATMGDDLAATAADAGDSLAALGTAGADAGTAIAGSMDGAAAGLQEVSAAAADAGSAMVDAGEEGDAALGSEGLVIDLSALADGFTELIGRAGEFAAGMLEFEAIAGTMTAVQGFVGSLIGMNAEFEKLHAQLTSITGSGADADKILAWVKKFGQQVPDTTEHLAQATVRIQSLGLNAMEVVPSIAKVAAAMGTDLPTAARAFTDAYEGRFIMLQNDLHVSKQELEQFGLQLDKHGHVLNNSLVPAFEKLAKVKFGNALTTQMGTLQGQLSNLTDRVQFFAMSMGAPLFQVAKDGLGLLFQMLDRYKPQIDAMAHAVGDGLATAFRSVGAAVVGVIGFFQHNETAMMVLKAAVIGLGVGLLALAIASIPSLIVALGGLAVAAWSAVIPILAGLAPFIAIGLAVAALGYAVMYAYQHFAPFRAAVAPLVTLMKQLWTEVQQAGHALVAYLMPFVQQAGAALAQFGSDMNSRLGPAMTNIVRLILWLVNVTKPIWTNLWQGLVQEFKGIWEILVGVFQVAWAIVAGLFKIALDLIGGNWGQAWTDLIDMFKGIWGGLVSIFGGVLDLIMGLLRTWFGPLLMVFSVAWNAIVAVTVGAWNGLVGWITGMVNNIHAIFSRFIQMEIKGWQENWNRLVSIVEMPIHAVVALFEWLFNHNYYFHNLVVAIEREFTLAKTIIFAVWTTVVSWLSGIWNNLVSLATTVWTFIVDTIQNEFNRARELITIVASFIMVYLQTTWQRVVTDVQTAWNTVIGFITGLYNRIHTAIQNYVITPIMNLLTGLATQLYQWGVNAIQMLINGITSMASKVGDAAKNVAKNIAGALGFHSPPPEGPAADSDEWAPNLMKMMAGGIDDNIHLLRAAAGRAAGVLGAGLNGAPALVGAGSGVGSAVGSGAVAGAFGQATAPSSSGPTTNTINLTIPIDTNDASAGSDETPEETGARFGTSVGTALLTALAQQGISLH